MNPARLKELISEAKQTGKPSEELVSAIEQIARGRISRLRLAADPDYVHEAVVHCLTVLHRIDERRNAFSYLTTCCYRTWLQMSRRRKNEAKKISLYAEQLRGRKA